MNKHFFVATAVLFISSLSQAQKDTVATALDEVVVTANKFPNKTSLTGKVVTVITREQIEKSGGKDLAQLLNEQSGVYINGASSNQGKDKSVFVRGAKIDYTLITIDGMPMYDASGIGSNFDIRLFALDNIERIEILKGSQSTLYGSDAIAGVINIITRKASTEKMKASGSVSYGSFNSLRGNAGISGSRSQMNYTLQYSFFSTDGINEASDTIPNNIMTTDKDGYKQQNLYAAIGWQPNKNISIQPYVRYTKIRGDIDQGAFTDELDFRFGIQNSQWGLKNKFTFGKNTLNLVYNFNRINRDFLDDSTQSINGWSKYSAGKYSSNEHYAEAYWFAPLSQLLKLTIGSDYRRANTFQSYEEVGLFEPKRTYTSLESVQQHQIGVYAAINLTTTKGFNMEAGGRFNKHSAYGYNSSFNINPSYLFNNQWKLYTNLSSGYKTPSLYQLYSEYGNKSLQPEAALNLEGGVQVQSKNKKISGRLTYFNRSIEDVIAFYYNPSTNQSYYINQDKQKDNGCELEAEWRPNPAMKIKLFYTYVDGKITTTNGLQDTTFFNLTARPRNSAGMYISYQVNSHLFMSLNANGVGKRWINTYDADFNPISLALKGYALVDLYGEYYFTKAKCRVFVNLLNLANSRFMETYGYNTAGFNVTGGCRFVF